MSWLASPDLRVPFSLCQWYSTHFRIFQMALRRRRAKQAKYGVWSDWTDTLNILNIHSRFTIFFSISECWRSLKTINKQKQTNKQTNKQNKTKQNKTKQSKAKQNKQNKTKQTTFWVYPNLQISNILVLLSSISSCLRLTDTPAGAAGAPNLDLLLGIGCFCQCYAQESVQNLLKTTAYVSGIFNNDTSMHICIGRSIYLYDVCVFTVNICIYIYIYIYIGSVNTLATKAPQTPPQSCRYPRLEPQTLV